jgi:hypothetical protein
VRTDLPRFAALSPGSWVRFLRADFGPKMDLGMVDGVWLARFWGPKVGREKGTVHARLVRSGRQMGMGWALGTVPFCLVAMSAGSG